MLAKEKLVLGYCPIGNGHSIHPFDGVFDVGRDISHGFEGVHAVVFWGGTDIHPSLYNEGFNKYSQASDKMSSRDTFEWKAMSYCIANNIPMIGVCRGAQMLCAKAGGRLIQHVNGHVGHGSHKITVAGEGHGLEFMVTSCHHQMMFPYDIPHELLAWSTDQLSDVYLDGKDKPIKEMDNELEPEVVYFPGIKGLAVQGHPEWMNYKDKFVPWFNKLIVEKLFNEVTA